MKKTVILAVAFAFVMGFAGLAAADTILPGASYYQDPSVMSVGKTMMDIGARDRSMTEAVNRASRANMATNNAEGSVNVDFQFGSSQSEQSWKAATLSRSVEQARAVGLIPGDCRGDNSGDAYRKQMNQSRDGFMAEPLVSDKDCADNHATVK
ncbi:MAG: hypothetical protein COV67_06545 [Nitrospinae bacterium CG11_big_fil_rev_8_21_14_0_20_56_8]|nr:MAG: hypothetical protein COV67_06545 [Nitrospinae bacterium CG11_big_fil_rev_8_21_14_0_20_56_8]